MFDLLSQIVNVSAQMINFLYDSSYIHMYIHRQMDIYKQKIILFLLSLFISSSFYITQPINDQPIKHTFIYYRHTIYFSVHCIF